MAAILGAPQTFRTCATAWPRPAPTQTPPDRAVWGALGDIDALCAPKADKLGRQQRLQLIGAFMEPLGTPNVDTRYASAFKHYSAQVSTPPAADAAAEAALVTAAKSEVLVVDGSAAGAASE